MDEWGLFMRKRQGRRELGWRKRKRNGSSTNHVEATPLEDGVVVTPCWGGDVNIFVFAEVGNKLASGTERASAGEDLDAASTFKRWVVLTEGKPAAALHHAYCDDVIASELQPPHSCQHKTRAACLLPNPGRSRTLMAVT